MSLYRGAGGASDATDDSTVNAVAGYASDAATSAAAAAVSAEEANVSATSAAANAAATVSVASAVSINAANAAISAELANTSAIQANNSSEDAAASAALAALSVSNTVNLSDNQTVGGIKTFTSNPVISSSAGPSLYLNKTGTLASTNFVGYNSGMLSYNSDQFNEATGSGHQFVVDGTEGMRLTSTGLSLAATSDLTVNKGTANGIVYLNNNKVLSNDSFVTYDGSTFFVGRTFEAAAIARFTGPYAQVGFSTGTDTANPDFRLVRRNNWPLTQIIRFRGESVSDAEVGMGLTIESLNNSAVYEMRYVISPDGSYQAWGKGTSERMRLNATGLGIGNSNPSAKLDVTGTAKISGDVTLSGGTATGVPYLNISKVLTSDSALTFDGTVLGIGSVTPPSYNVFPRVYIQQTTDTAWKGLMIGAAGSDAYLGIYYTGGVFNYSASYGVDAGYKPMAWQVGGSEQMRLTATTLSLTNNPTLTAGTVNGIPYLNAAKELTTGNGLTFDGTGAVSVNAALNSSSWNSAYSRYTTGATSLVGVSNGTVSHLTSNLTDTSGSGAWVFNLSTSNRGSVLTQAGGVMTWSATPTAGTGSNTALPLQIISAAWTKAIQFNSSANPGSFVNYGTATITDAVTLSGGTANGVTYLNGSKVLTSGSALTFDGNNLSIGANGQVGSRLSVIANGAMASFNTGAAADGRIEYAYNGTNIFYTGVNSSSLLMLMARSGVELGFGANNSEQMRLTSTGLGIGTSNPTARLVVQQANNTGDGIRLFANGNDSQLITRYLASIDAWQITASYASTGAYKPITWFTSDLERMRLDSSGNLGLGVTPSAWGAGKAFEVGNAGNAFWGVGTADIRISANAYFSSGFQNLYAATGFATRYDQTAGVHKWFNAPSGTAGASITFTQAMTLDASGNLSVGTTTANTRFTAAGTGQLLTGTTNGTVEIVQDFTTKRGLHLGYDSSGQIGVIAANSAGAASNLAFWTFSGSTWGERARIDSSGNLLVGTTTAGGVGATVYSAVNNSNVGRIDLNKSASGAATGLSMRYNGTQVGSITYDNTSTSFNTSSDYRLKDITGPITTSGAYIDSLNPVEGTWKADGSTFVGLIAHEAQEASRTQVATGVKDGEEMQGMSYSSSEMIANIIAELKALRARVAALEAA